MNPQRADEAFDDLVALVRAYGMRHTGQTAVSVTIHFPEGRPMELPFPRPPAKWPGATCRPGPAVRAGPESDWASGPEPKALSDCQRVYWPGLGEFTFSAKQRAAVQLLWEAYQDGTWEAPQDVLLRAADSDSTRLRDLFARSPAWRKLIVPVPDRPGNYRLAQLPEEEDEK